MGEAGRSQHTRKVVQKMDERLENIVQPEFEPLLSDQQAAQLLGNMHPRTLQRLARTGVIPAIKIGRFWFFRASTLDAWVSSQVQSQHRPCFSKENE